MSVSLSHQLWVWFLAAFLVCIFLVDVFHVAVPEILIGLLALFTALSLFVQVGHNTPPA